MSVANDLESLTRREQSPGESSRLSFELAVLPHLDAAYNLARWLTGNHHDAEDLAQEAYLRAFKSFDGFRGGDGRAWLLAIVRNTCYSWLEQNRSKELTTVFDEEIHRIENDATNPESLLLRNAEVQMLRRVLEELPVDFREVLILRELEGMSYEEIAHLAEIPVGTVMSRLARARRKLLQALPNSVNEKRRKPAVIGNALHASKRKSGRVPVQGGTLEPALSFPADNR